MNIVRTALLLAGLTTLLLVVGWLAGGGKGVAIALALALVVDAVAIWKSDGLVLGMVGAVELDRRAVPGLYEIVARLAAKAGMPAPHLHICESAQPNAFATGRDPAHAVICTTSGLLDHLSSDEVEGVIAHELAHIRHRDSLVMTVTASLAGAIGMLPNFGWFFGGVRRDGQGGGPLGWIGAVLAVLLAPLEALLVQATISRSREFDADDEGARLCGHPLWLASALERLDYAATCIPNYDVEAHPATAHLFIVNPLTGRRYDRLFSTHPSTAERIARLRRMAEE